MYYRHFEYYIECTQLYKTMFLWEFFGRLPVELYVFLGSFIKCVLQEKTKQGKNLAGPFFLYERRWDIGMTKLFFRSDFGLYFLLILIFPGSRIIRFPLKSISLRVLNALII